MSTVAFDGKTMAGDRLADCGGFAWETAKIFKVKFQGKSALYGGVGSLEEVLAVKEWIESGCATEKPDLKDYAGLLVLKEGMFRLESKLILMPILETFHAIGSGRDYAIAAMHLGKTAEEAVELATVYDTYTGKGVDTLKWR